MADYHPLIARAVAGLEKNTGDGRRALYERARSALIAQLRSTEPALSESEITRERLALEEAIRKVEAESARQNRMEANRAEPKPKMRAPDPAKWEELGRPPGSAAPAQPSSASPGRRGDSLSTNGSAPRQTCRRRRAARDPSRRRAGSERRSAPLQHDLR